MERNGHENAGFGATLKRTLTEFQEDNLTDWAAALTYYGLLVAVPGADRDGLADRHLRRPADHDPEA